MTFDIPPPELQVSFARALGEIRATLLQDALRQTISTLDIPTIDKELADLVPGHSLAILAGHGLRGELMFAVPAVLGANPRLLAYYRLLYGYSQKEFFKSGIAGPFKALESKGSLTRKNAVLLLDLCRAMAGAGVVLLAGLSAGHINGAILDDLTLLTLGPQLRGRTNVKIGTAAITIVFGVIKGLVSASIVSLDQNRINVTNAAGRIVSIEFASDPDIIIIEALPSGGFRHVVAIEVKGGRDFSNVHNRIGEAEKSHQKARANRFTECWTVVNVDKFDRAMAKRESPSTDRFYRISDLIASNGSEFEDFRDRIIALTGIR